MLEVPDLQFHIFTSHPVTLTVVYTGKHTKLLSMKQAEKFLHSMSKAVRSHSHTADSQKPHTPMPMDINTPVQVQPSATRQPANLAPASSKHHPRGQHFIYPGCGESNPLNLANFVGPVCSHLGLSVIMLNVS